MSERLADRVREKETGYGFESWAGLGGGGGGWGVGFTPAFRIPVNKQKLQRNKAEVKWVVVVVVGVVCC